MCKENSKCSCQPDCKPDYEREYYGLVELVKKLENENLDLKNTLLGICKTLFNKE